MGNNFNIIILKKKNDICYLSGLKKWLIIASEPGKIKRSRINYYSFNCVNFRLTLWFNPNQIILLRLNESKIYVMHTFYSYLKKMLNNFFYISVDL